jgi:hypothetical protein
MYDLLLQMMGHEKDSVSFYSRLEATDAFFKRYKLYREMWPSQVDEPLSFVWAISSIKHPELFNAQIGAISQFDGLLHSEDNFIFVCDEALRDTVLSTTSGLRKAFKTEVMIIDRGCAGDRPVLNWDIGFPYAAHERLLFIRDLALMFQPWDLISSARKVDISTTLTNYSVILGPVWSRFVDRWVYLVHPRFAPGPFLFSFVASKSNVEKINGFDLNFRQGYDHIGDLDFLLRWNMAGLDYQITEDALLLHPGLAVDQEDIEKMHMESSIPRRYFFDRYDPKFISELEYPYKLEPGLIDVCRAETMIPLSEVVYPDYIETFPAIEHAFDFSKLPPEVFVKEVL